MNTINKILISGSTYGIANTSTLQVSDTTNKKINTAESTDNYIQFTGGTNKFTVTDGTKSFDVGVTPNITNGELIHYVENPSGTAGNTASGSYNRTQWTGTCTGVTSLYTGLTVTIKIPIAGVARGVSLNVNNLGEHPVLYNMALLTT